MKDNQKNKNLDKNLIHNNSTEKKSLVNSSTKNEATSKKPSNSAIIKKLTYKLRKAFLNKLKICVVRQKKNRNKLKISPRFKNYLSKRLGIKQKIGRLTRTKKVILLKIKKLLARRKSKFVSLKILKKSQFAQRRNLKHILGHLSSKKLASVLKEFNGEWQKYYSSKAKKKKLRFFKPRVYLTYMSLYYIRLFDRLRNIIRHMSTSPIRKYLINVCRKRRKSYLQCFVKTYVRSKPALKRIFNIQNQRSAYFPIKFKSKRSLYTSPKIIKNNKKAVKTKRIPYFYNVNHKYILTSKSAFIFKNLVKKNINLVNSTLKLKTLAPIEIAELNSSETDYDSEKKEKESFGVGLIAYSKIEFLKRVFFSGSYSLIKNLYNVKTFNFLNIKRFKTNKSKNVLEHWFNFTNKKAELRHYLSPILISNPENLKFLYSTIAKLYSTCYSDFAQRAYLNVKDHEAGDFGEFSSNIFTKKIPSYASFCKSSLLIGHEHKSSDLQTILKNRMVYKALLSRKLKPIFVLLTNQVFLHQLAKSKSFTLKQRLKIYRKLLAFLKTSLAEFTPQKFTNNLMKSEFFSANSSKVSSLHLALIEDFIKYRNSRNFKVRSIQVKSQEAYKKLLKVTKAGLTKSHVSSELGDIYLDVLKSSNKLNKTSNVLYRVRPTLITKHISYLSNILEVYTSLYVRKLNYKEYLSKKVFSFKNSYVQKFHAGSISSLNTGRAKFLRLLLNGHTNPLHGFGKYFNAVNPYLNLHELKVFQRILFLLHTTLKRKEEFSLNIFIQRKKDLRIISGLLSVLSISKVCKLYNISNFQQVYEPGENSAFIVIADEIPESFLKEALQDNHLILTKVGLYKQSSQVHGYSVTGEMSPLRNIFSFITYLDSAYRSLNSNSKASSILKIQPKFSSSDISLKRRKLRYLIKLKSLKGTIISLKKRHNKARTAKLRIFLGKLLKKAVAASLRRRQMYSDLRKSIKKASAQKRAFTVKSNNIEVKPLVNNTLKTNKSEKQYVSKVKPSVDAAKQLKTNNLEKQSISKVEPEVNNAKQFKANAPKKQDVSKVKPSVNNKLKTNVLKKQDVSKVKPQQTQIKPQVKAEIKPSQPQDKRKLTQEEKKAAKKKNEKN